MRTDRSPEQIRGAALKVIGIEMSDLVGRERTPMWICRAREAVTGAMYNLSSHQPSLTELGKLCGKRHHTTALDQVRRYNRDWPPVLRIAWEASVIKEIG